jgi:predicted permease
VLISENYWQARFAGDPGIIGTTVHLNGAAVKVIGVTPRNFVGTGVSVPDFWLPASLEPLVHPTVDVLRDREDQRFRIFGRLAPGASISDAQAEMTPLVDALRLQHEPLSETAKPGAVVVWRGSPFPLPLKAYAGLTQTILLVMIAAAMVLVVACANVGSLQLARVQSRQSELRTRLSLGAGRMRIIRQLLTESALLGLVSGATALVLTWMLLKLAVRATANAVPVDVGTLVFDVTPDLTIFGYVLAISLLAAMLFGVLPAIESSGVALAATVRAATSPARSRRLQNLLVTAQVALTLVLLIAGSLFIRSALQSLHADAGYDSKRVVDIELQFPETSRYTAERKAVLAGELRSRVAALPAVSKITSAIPPDANIFQTAAVALDRAASPAGAGKRLLHYSYVEASYFQTLGVPVLQGRGFAPDAGEDIRSVILSESAAKQFWAGESAIGRMLRLGATDERRLFNVADLSADGPAYQVIGVVRDTRGVQFNGGDSRQIYLSLPADWRSTHPLMARTAADTTELKKAIEATATSVDPEVVATVSTLDDRLRSGGPFVVSSLAAAVALTVGLVGLVLAMMGIHGTVSYVVVLRTREVGIRMAIGAQRHDILGLILRESVRPVVAGLGVGLLLAVGASLLLRNVLFGLSALDGVSFGVVSVLFLTTALIAAYAPSRRATRVNPVVALRCE